MYSEITWEALAALLPENLNRSVEMAEGGSPRGSTEKGWAEKEKKNTYHSKKLLTMLPKSGING